MKMFVSANEEMSKDDIMSLTEDALFDLFCRRMKTWLLNPAKELLTSNADAGWVVVSVINEFYTLIGKFVPAFPINQTIFKNGLANYRLFISANSRELEVKERGVGVNPYLAIESCFTDLDYVRDNFKEELVKNFKIMLIKKFEVKEEIHGE